MILTFDAVDECQEKLQVIHADVSSSSADDQNDLVEASTLTMMESRALPTDVLRDFQHYQALKRQHELTHHHPSLTHHSSHHPADSHATMVPGIDGHYAMQHGVQYYRDLAGNVKQVSNMLALFDWQICLHHMEAELQE